MPKILILLLLVLSSPPTWGEAGLLGPEISTTSAVIPIQRKQAVDGRFFSANSGVVTSGTSEVPLFLFVNPSTNTVSAYLDWSMWGNYTETQSNFFVYRNAVVTSSGTSLTISPGRAASGAISKMQAFRQPTISSMGTIVFSVTASGNGPPAIMNLRQSRIFDPGTTFLITVDNSAANSISNVLVDWVEE